MFLADQPPLAVLLYGIGGGDEAIPAESILPVINAQNGLEIGQGDEGMQRDIRPPFSCFIRKGGGCLYGQ
jgi:hypothetical protein